MAIRPWDEPNYRLDRDAEPVTSLVLEGIAGIAGQGDRGGVR